MASLPNDGEMEEEAPDHAAFAELEAVGRTPHGVLQLKSIAADPQAVTMMQAMSRDEVRCRALAGALRGGTAIELVRTAVRRSSQDVRSVIHKITFCLLLKRKFTLLRQKNAVF